MSPRHAHRFAPREHVGGEAIKSSDSELDALRRQVGELTRMAVWHEVHLRPNKKGTPRIMLEMAKAVGRAMRTNLRNERSKTDRELADLRAQLGVLHKSLGEADGKSGED